jgi:hypothetical protein
MTPDALPVAVRVWTELLHPARARRGRAERAAAPPWPRSPYVLVFDTETTTDAAQALNFGVYRVCRWTRDRTLALVQEGLFFGDDLPQRDPAAYATLRGYAELHGFQPNGTSRRLLSCAEFIRNIFFPWAYSTRALVAGFNVPFDLSRLAVEWGTARGGMRGGFSLRLAEYVDAEGRRREHQYRPRVLIKHLDSKKSLIQFGRASRPDHRDDLIPEGTPGGPPDPTYTFRGHFLDMRTLVWALTNRSHSLKSAAETFGTEHRKADVESHGAITAEYLDYARRDVLVTAELLAATRREFDRHPLALEAPKAYSPASIGKAYLRAMGVRPPLKQTPDFPRNVLTAAMAAFFGGRAECRIRKVPAPIVLTDFTSMYPTVNALMDNWSLLTAARVEVEDATAWAREFLAAVTLDAMPEPGQWQQLRVLVELEPDGQDVLPVRAHYSESASSTYEIGLNPFGASEPYWYTLADCVASTILTGRPPRVRRAVRIVGHGRQDGLRATQLRGAVPVEPSERDFFRAVIEERQRYRSRADLAPVERERLGEFLKVLANSATYGIFAEMNRADLRVDKPVPVRVWPPHGEPHTRKLATPEEPGDFCFPPLAAFITGAARLMLALLERCVLDMGGSYVFCDTDSLAIVSSEHGGLVPCPGGAYQTADGQAAIRALSWAEVDGIVARFAALNPYDRSAVPGSILKVEAENFDPASGARRQLYCWAISAKRYCLYNLDPDGAPILRKVSEHGLGGVYLDPTDPRPALDPRGPGLAYEPEGDGDDESLEPAAVPVVKARPWIVEAWAWLLGEALGRPTTPPSWLDRPAVSRVTVSSPPLLAPFAGYNRKRPPGARVRPFNFVLLAHPADPFRAERISPMAPFEPDPRQWERMGWTDRHTGAAVRIYVERLGAEQLAGGRVRVAVQSFRHVLQSYRNHPEAKSCASDGWPADRQTVGLLQRRAVAALGPPALIGKEANKLEAVSVGLVETEAEVLNRYPDPEHSVWSELLRPVLGEMPPRLIREAVALSPRAILALRRGQPQPRGDHALALGWAAVTFAQAQLTRWGIQIEPLPDSLRAVSLAQGRLPRQALAVLTRYSEHVRGCKRRCASCGAELADGAGRRRYCSATCRWRAWRTAHPGERIE